MISNKPRALLGHALFMTISFMLFWGMSSSVAEEPAPLFKNQRLSSTKWGEVDIEKFLSVKDWIVQRDQRDQVPEWETIVRERNNREIVGRFFQCVGRCRLDRGQSFFNPNFKTAIYEGDEVLTIGDSYAWIFLLDGTMIRLSPESSINFNEFNIGVSENFINARINFGNVLWLSRSQALFEEQNLRETDVLFNPLNLYEAQPITDKRSYEEDNLIELVSESNTVLNQYKNLNQLIEKNNTLTKGKLTYAFIVTPNMTIMGYAPSVEIVSLLSGKTFFKRRSPDLLGHKKNEEKEESGNDEIIQLRGYENSTLLKAQFDQWMVVDEKGRSLSDESENLNWLTMGEFITKRIPSLMVARELLLGQYSEMAFREKYDPFVLASNDGYRLWGKLKAEGDEKKADLKLRLDFLKEYFRRTETTNLLIANHFSEQLKARGETLKSMEYGNYFFSKALDKYYSYEGYSEKETGEVLNSTTKILWKKMHGIR